MGWWSFDDSKVQGYINRAMAKNASFQPIDTQLERAWYALYSQRKTDDPDGDDRELAAAEHYMYARWQVCSGQTSEAMMRLLVLGYDPAKLIGYHPIPRDPQARRTFLVTPLHGQHEMGLQGN